jgi:hypothetical protein
MAVYKIVTHDNITYYTDKEEAVEDLTSLTVNSFSKVKNANLESDSTGEIFYEVVLEGDEGKSKTYLYADDINMVISRMPVLFRIVSIKEIKGDILTDSNFI